MQVMWIFHVLCCGLSLDQMLSAWQRCWRVLKLGLKYGIRFQVVAMVSSTQLHILFYCFTHCTGWIIVEPTVPTVRTLQLLVWKFCLFYVQKSVLMCESCMWNCVCVLTWPGGDKRQHNIVEGSDVLGRRLIAPSADILLGRVTVPLFPLLTHTTGLFYWGLLL